MKVGVHTVGREAMREKRSLTQRRLAHDLGISQSYNQLVREVLEQVAVDHDEALETMVTVMPTPPWAGLFRMVLLARKQALTARLEVPGEGPAFIDGMALSELRGSEAQTTLSHPSTVCSRTFERADLGWLEGFEPSTLRSTI